MSPEVRKARELRARGLSFAAIGEALGRDRSWVRGHARDVPLPERECRWCGESFCPTNPRARFCSARCRRALCEDNNRGACVDCGAELSAGSAWGGPRRCVPCHRRSEAERLALRSRQIEEWWAEGVSMKQIAARLGWSKGHLEQEMHRMRERGCSLPYRRRLTKPRFPDQVAP